ncbi:MAG: decarboxylating 6-phosphogluconate dehydrogenase [Elusimicrobia bacterium]|nr:decarboxylating 6-phosphogluconate dehydrogenase [Elusimicrobiota bacterium]
MKKLKAPPNIEIIGFGKMGSGIARRFRQSNINAAVWDQSPKQQRQAIKSGFGTRNSLVELTRSLGHPKILWLMLPHSAVDAILKDITNLLGPGDIIIDGGNSHYQDSRRRFQEFNSRNIGYLDAGISGGIGGADSGYCLMIGGDAKIFRQALFLFEALAVPGGLLYCGPAGAGHYVKMIHNAIEYGLLQSYAEGFELLRQAPYPIAVKDVARLWCQASIVRSWILELIARVLAKDQDLSRVAKDAIDDGGEARWSVIEATGLGQHLPVITMALFERLASQKSQMYSRKLINALRHEFGGHSAS